MRFLLVLTLPTRVGIQISVNHINLAPTEGIAVSKFFECLLLSKRTAEEIFSSEERGVFFAEIPSRLPRRSRGLEIWQLQDP